MKGMFARKSAPGRAGTVKKWVVELLELTEDDLVTIAELACHEPGCPPVETVVTVHGADGKRRTWRVHKALGEIEHTDVRDALAKEPEC